MATLIAVISIGAIGVGLLYSGAKAPYLIAITASAVIISGAFVVCWAAEVLQHDISATVALACLAAIAVLPEYVVDVYLAWKAGKDETYAQYVVANMTGGNRLLIGIGWVIVIAIVCFRQKIKSFTLKDSLRLGLLILLAATLYNFSLPVKGYISLVDCGVLFGLFTLYVLLAFRGEIIRPHLTGPTLWLVQQRFRKLYVIFLFAIGAFYIISACKPFSESLIQVGKSFQINEFILIQWVAPLASEAPELTVACILAFHRKMHAAMCTLISSKINQWTLLVGMLPLVFTISAEQILPLPLSVRQSEEILLTCAQSLFAAILIANLRLSFIKAIVLFLPFVIQLTHPMPFFRYGFSFYYLCAMLITILMRDELRRATFALLPRTIAYLKQCKKVSTTSLPGEDSF